MDLSQRSMNGLWGVRCRFRMRINLFLLAPKLVEWSCVNQILVKAFSYLTVSIAQTALGCSGQLYLSIHTKRYD
jgi:hypothetical protein